MNQPHTTGGAAAPVEPGPAGLAVEDLVVDESIRSLIPPPSEDELDRLEQNILAEGRCRDPLVAWKGRRVLLDGHNRRDVILRHGGVRYQVVEMEFADVAGAMAWVIRNQLGRRNISDFVRAELACKLKPLLAARAREREWAGKAPPPPPHPRQNSDEGRTDQQLARLAGVSRDTVRKVEKVIGSAVPQVVELARRGEISINAAARAARLPEPEQREAAGRGSAGIKAGIRQAGNVPATQAAVDATGRAIASGTVAAAFRAAAALDEILQRLTRLSRDLGVILGGPAGAFFDPNNVTACLQELRAEIAQRRPHAVCRFCGGEPDQLPGGCDNCRNSGFLPKGGSFAFEAITPEELR